MDRNRQPMDPSSREPWARGGLGGDRLGRRAFIPGELLMLGLSPAGKAGLKFAELGAILYRMKDGK